MSKTTQHSASVIVHEEVKEVHAFEPDTLLPTVLGSLISRVYQGERVQRHSFVPVGEGKGEFSLGPTTTQFKFVDHTEAMKPLLDAGYKIKDQIIGKGGLQVYSIMEPENPVIVRDPITWDHEIWGVGKDTDPTLTETLIFSTTIRPGKGIHYRKGVFRQVCTNGMVAEVLGLGSARFTHTNWTAAGVAKVMVDSPTLSDHTVRGPYLGNRKGVTAFQELLTRYADIAGEDEEDETPLPNIPFYIAKSLSPLLRMPKWWRDQFCFQLSALAENNGDDVHVLDLLNAITSPVSLERNANPDRAVLRPLSRVGTLVENAAQFIGTLSL